MRPVSGLVPAPEGAEMQLPVSSRGRGWGQAELRDRFCSDLCCWPVSTVVFGFQKGFHF